MDRDGHIKTDRESMKIMAQAAVNVLSVGYMYLILQRILLYLLGCTQKRGRGRKGREREERREGRRESG